jgi:hypothetical protein
MTKGSRHSCRNDRVEKDLFSLREFPVEDDETTRTNYSEVQPGTASGSPIRYTF